MQIKKTNTAVTYTLTLSEEELSALFGAISMVSTNQINGALRRHNLKEIFDSNLGSLIYSQLRDVLRDNK